MVANSRFRAARWMGLGLLLAVGCSCQAAAEPTLDAPSAGRAVGISTDNPGTMWVAAPRKGAYTSSDGGHHWARILGTFGVSALTFVPRGTLLVSGRHVMVAPIGAFQSVPMRRAPTAFASLATPYPPTRRVYGLDHHGRVWVSVNQGWSWQRLTCAGLPNGTRAIAALRNKPIRPDTIYAAVPRRGIWISTDYGLTFHQMPGAPPATAVAVTTDDPTRILAATPGGIYVSNDAGASWQKVDNTTVVSVALDYRNSQNAVALTADGDLLRSANGGASWGPSS